MWCSAISYNVPNVHALVLLSWTPFNTSLSENIILNTSVSSSQDLYEKPLTNDFSTQIISALSVPLLVRDWSMVFWLPKVCADWIDWKVVWFFSLAFSHVVWKNWLLYLLHLYFLLLLWSSEADLPAVNNWTVL